MRSKKTLVNITVALITQLVSIVCGLIVPILIISTYGSGVNGLLSSITQFLGYIVLIEAGVGGVVRAALYKPLAQYDINSISGIIKATTNFFRIVAYIFVGYLVVVIVFFSYLVREDFDSLFTITLVLVIGVSIFFQYYFGISYQILLQSDQRQYVTSSLQIITMIVNTILIVLLINLGASILIVKLASSIVFVVRPIILYFYVKKRYKLVNNCKPDNNAIKQRWNGLGHHLAFLLHNNTDIALLTFFSDIRMVSVYSIYSMVVSSIRKLTVTFSSGIEAAFGNMIAKDESEALNRNFRVFELLSFTITTILFTSTALLIIPFISIYTRGITDVNYNIPLFAYVLVAAEAAYCIRVPYNAVVLAAGHYKETRNGAFAEALINIIVSSILINIIGIVGVAVGTLCAMFFRTVQYAIYLSNNVVKRSIWIFIKKIMIYLISTTIIILIVNLFPHLNINSYINWFMYAVGVTLISSIVTFIMSALFYLDDIKSLLLIMRRVTKK